MEQTRKRTRNPPEEEYRIQDCAVIVVLDKELYNTELPNSSNIQTGVFNELFPLDNTKNGKIAEGSILSINPLPNAKSSRNIAQVEGSRII